MIFRTVLKLNWGLAFNPKRPGGAAAVHQSGDRLPFLIGSSFQHSNFTTCFKNMIKI